jgi:hypothetical protein
MVPGVLALLILAMAAAPAHAQAIRVPPPDGDRLDVKGALLDSLMLLGIEHGVRIAFQEKTRRELGGPFWSDYVRSVRTPKGWEDGDSWLVNYVGHPIHGAAAGFVWLAHDPRSRDQEFGLNRRYWSTRWRPVVAAAIYSVQFEVGPISEASIGNVGLNPRTTGWVDYVVTPVGAMAILVGEDALDRFFVRWVEQHTGNRFFRGSLRVIFGPSRLMANLAVGRAPWHRGTRPIGWR